jgi:predicted transcriptional regulator
MMDLRAERSALGISQSRLARMSRVSRFKICTFELGSGVLNPDELDRIKSVFRAEADRLRRISGQIDVAIAHGAEGSCCATQPPNIKKTR